MTERNVTSYSELRRAEKECDPGELILTNVGFLLALRKGSDNRDEFAGQAMSGLLSAFKRWPHNDDSDTDRVAGIAYRQADAMLKAREA